MPDINNLKVRMIYFSSQFQRFQSMVAGPHTLGQSIMVVGTCGGESCSPHSRQEAESKTERSPGQDTAPKDISPVTYFLQLGLIS
jgi:hypothetical protein